TSAPQSVAAPSMEPQLGPTQISPERLQQIGVTTAVAQMKNVSDKLSVAGNVEMNEQSLFYVQTRFAGWIQNVFADATYQYVQKGQKLFTIYSPDLVSTEQEYLLAKQNQKTLAPNPHGMAAQEGGWLLDAAEERLRLVHRHVGVAQQVGVAGAVVGKDGDADARRDHDRLAVEHDGLGERGAD